MIPYRASLRSDLASRGLSEPPDSLPRNRWTICPGPAGRFGSEQVDELDRNEWTLSSGPGGRFHRNTQTACCVCGTDLGAVYGDVVRRFVLVHQLRPLSEIAGEYEVDPVHDLRPVCRNCHAVIHLRGGH